MESNSNVNTSVDDARNRLMSLTDPLPHSAE
jgi:hypothetical protein